MGSLYTRGDGVHISRLCKYQWRSSFKGDPYTQAGGGGHISGCSLTKRGLYTMRTFRYYKGGRVYRSGFSTYKGDLYTRLVVIYKGGRVYTRGSFLHLSGFFPGTGDLLYTGGVYVRWFFHPHCI